MRLIPNFISKLFHKKEESVKYDTFYQNANLMSKEQKEMLKSCKNVLTENKIALSKLKFVFDKSFSYDVDNNVINPTYKQLVPNSKKHHTIEIGVPINLMTVFLGENRTYNNYSLLKEKIRKSKRGVAILVSDDYDEVMWLASLDDAHDFFWTTHDEIE
jgi:hypothetical protein